MCVYMHYNDKVRDYMQTVLVVAERIYLQEWGQKYFLIHLVHNFFDSWQ